MRVDVGARSRSQTANSDPVTISTGCFLSVSFNACPFGQLAIGQRFLRPRGRRERVR